MNLLGILFLCHVVKVSTTDDCKLSEGSAGGANCAMCNTILDYPDHAAIEMLTYNMFSFAVTNQQGIPALSGVPIPFPPPSTSLFNLFIEYANIEGGISTLGEAAMLLANMIIVTLGFTQLMTPGCSPETGCVNLLNSTGPPPPYGIKDPNCENNYFYGRGYIGLSYCQNYRSFSQYYYGNESVLVNDPDILSTNQTIAMISAMWYWKTYCHGRTGVQKYKFGASIKCINPGVCTSAASSEDNYENDLKSIIYLYVRGAFGLNHVPKFCGCCGYPGPLNGPGTCPGFKSCAETPES